MKQRNFIGNLSLGGGTLVSSPLLRFGRNKTNNRKQPVTNAEEDFSTIL